MYDVPLTRWVRAEFASDTITSRLTTSADAPPTLGPPVLRLPETGPLNLERRYGRTHCGLSSAAFCLLRGPFDSCPSLPCYAHEVPQGCCFGVDTLRPRYRRHGRTRRLPEPNYLLDKQFGSFTIPNQPIHFQPCPETSASSITSTAFEGRGSRNTDSSCLTRTASTLASSTDDKPSVDSFPPQRYPQSPAD